MGNWFFRWLTRQPIMCRVLISEDGQGWDATECCTCRTVLGPWPQPPHSLEDCVRELAHD